jgi:MFS family permease
MIIMSYFSAILVLALWLPSRANAPIILFTILYGFSTGAFVSLVPALVAQISDVRQIGIRTGALFAVVSVGALTGNPIGGALVPDVEHGEFWKMQVFSGVALAAGSTVFVLARLKVTGPKLLTKF